MGLSPRYILDFSQVYKEDEDLVGKKAHEFGMLWKLGIPLPSGFVVTTEFYKEFLHATSIHVEIKKVRALDHPAISDSVKKLLPLIQKQIMKKPIPQELAVSLHKYYRKFFGALKSKPLDISSSTLNDKVIEFNNVLGDANLIYNLKKIWSSSLEEPVAIVVQENIKFDTKGKIVTNTPIANKDKKLTKLQVNKLLDYCKKIQKHFYFPKELEYVIKNSKIYITKINPFTGSADDSSKLNLNNGKRKMLAKGTSLNPGIVTGPVKVLRNNFRDIRVKRGEVVIMSSLDLSLFGDIKNARALIIESVLLNSLDKALYRKNFQIPTIEGVRDATKVIQNRNIVTVNGTNGEIYSGGLIY